MSHPQTPPTPSRATSSRDKPSPSRLRAAARLRRGSLPHLIALGASALVLCGLGFWYLEPTVDSFGDGLWLAFTTASTVGYGDIVPTTWASKAFACCVVLVGFALLSLVTAAVAARWVKDEELKIEQEILLELHEEIRQLRAELSELRQARALAPSR